MIHVRMYPCVPTPQFVEDRGERLIHRRHWMEQSNRCLSPTSSSLNQSRLNPLSYAYSCKLSCVSAFSVSAILRRAQQWMLHLNLVLPLAEIKRPRTKSGSTFSDRLDMR